MSDMMWGGRFTKAEEKNALDFNASISYDCRMYREDIAGSIAHAKMLASHGIISKEDQEKITQGLLSIKKEIDEGTFPFSIELEDIHMNIENVSLRRSVMPVPVSTQREAAMTSVRWIFICT